MFNEYIGMILIIIAFAVIVWTKELLEKYKPNFIDYLKKNPDTFWFCIATIFLVLKFYSKTDEYILFFGAICIFCYGLAIGLYTGLRRT